MLDRQLTLSGRNPHSGRRAAGCGRTTHWRPLSGTGSAQSPYSPPPRRTGPTIDNHDPWSDADMMESLKVQHELSRGLLA